MTRSTTLTSRPPTGTNKRQAAPTVDYPTLCPRRRLRGMAGSLRLTPSWPRQGGAGVSEERPMAAGEADKVPDRNRFRKTLVRVLIVQVVSLVLLWALQAHYNVM